MYFEDVHSLSKVLLKCWPRTINHTKIMMICSVASVNLVGIIRFLFSSLIWTKSLNIGAKTGWSEKLQFKKKERILVIREKTSIAKWKKTLSSSYICRIRWCWEKPNAEFVMITIECFHGLKVFGVCLREMLTQFLIQNPRLCFFFFKNFSCLMQESLLCSHFFFCLV